MEPLKTVIVFIEALENINFHEERWANIVESERQKLHLSSLLILISENVFYLILVYWLK